MNLDKRFSIGDAEKATGVKVVTIRYYEQIGLMPKPMRTTGNYRTYNQEHLARLLFIRRCRDLGFTLCQVNDFLSLSAQDDDACAVVDQITTTHLKEIERRITDLKRLAVELRRIKSRCPGKGRIADCRILEALSPPVLLRDDPTPRCRVLRGCNGGGPRLPSAGRGLNVQAPPTRQRRTGS